MDLEKKEPHVPPEDKRKTGKKKRKVKKRRKKHETRPVSPTLASRPSSSTSVMAQPLYTEPVAVAKRTPSRPGDLFTLLRPGDSEWIPRQSILETLLPRELANLISDYCLALPFEVQDATVVLLKTMIPCLEPEVKESELMLNRDVSSEFLFETEVSRYTTRRYYRYKTGQKGCRHVTGYEEFYPEQEKKIRENEERLDRDRISPELTEDELCTRNLKFIIRGGEGVSLTAQSRYVESERARNKDAERWELASRARIFHVHQLSDLRKKWWDHCFHRYLWIFSYEHAFVRKSTCLTVRVKWPCPHVRIRPDQWFKRLGMFQCSSPQPNDEYVWFDWVSLPGNVDVYDFESEWEHDFPLFCSQLEWVD